MSNFDEFWARYPGKKVAKPKCKIKYDKLSDDEHKSVMLAIEAQIRYRTLARRKDEFVAEWCNSQTFINQQRWFDEIESHAELNERAESKICSVEGCKAPVLGSRFCHCEHHYQYDEQGRMRGHLGLVAELRKHYAEHPEIHELRGQAALKFIRYKIAEVLK